MSEHLALRSSVGSPSPSAPPTSTSTPTSRRTRALTATPDPLASVWIRRLHLTPNPPTTPRPPPPPRSAGFGPFCWSPRPLRGTPVGAWDAAAAASGSGRGPPMLSPFFRLPPPPAAAVADMGDFAPFRPMTGLGSSSGSGGFTGLPSRMVVGGDANASWLAARAAGAAHPSHAVDMVPIRTLRDLHDRQHSMIPQNFGSGSPSSSSQHDEPFSYWNMGRFRRNTTTSSISPITVAPGNFGKKRNADSNSFPPLKFRKLSGAT